MKCFHRMRVGLAMLSTVSPLCKTTPGATQWAGGPGKLVRCLKCSKCGYSVTI